MKAQRLRSACQGILRLWMTVACCQVSFAQDLLVTDEKGTPLIGVEVFTDDFNVAGVTNSDGIFRLNRTVTHLSFNYLGYERKRLSQAEIVKRDYLIVLRPVSQLIEEVIILGRNEVRQEEIPFRIETVTKEEIASTQPQTSADALHQHGGVFVQKSQMGGGSPVIRGFEANRVLLVVDGVRMNNAIYRNGHLQNAITVDQAILDKMDVIFGPNSLLYGSDALGGVVHFQTVEPSLTTQERSEVNGNYYGRFSSANREKTVHADFTVSGKKWSGLTSITFSDFGDLRSGSRRNERFPDFGKRLIYQDTDEEGRDVVISNDNPNIQIGTAYSQLDVLQKLRWRPNIHSNAVLNIQYSTSSDVPRYDNLSEIDNDKLRWGEWYYGPQNRFLASLHYRNLKPKRYADQSTLIASYQRIDEDRIERSFGRQVRLHQEEDVHVIGLTGDFTKFLDKDHLFEIDYGIDLQHNLISSTAFSSDVRSGQESGGVLSRYASDFNRWSTMGAFAYLRKKSVNDLFNWSAGLRYNLTDYTLRYSNDDIIDWPELFIEGVNGFNGAVTWSIGGTMNHPSGWQVRALLSSAFRSPNIDDLSKIRVNADEITFPNLDLKPEKSVNAELTAGYSFNSDLKLNATAFYTRLDNAIVRDAFTTPNGLTTWVTSGDTLMVVANQNIAQAEIRGISASFYWDINGAWSLRSSGNWTYGNDTGSGEPLAHIPPFYGQTVLALEKGAFRGRMMVSYNGRKPLDKFGGSEDNPELATPDGALAWMTYNLYSSYSIDERWSVSLALENITDLHYRTFSSGVSAPGRNLIVSLRGNF